MMSCTSPPEEKLPPFEANTTAFTSSASGKCAKGIAELCIAFEGQWVLPLRPVERDDRDRAIHAPAEMLWRVGSSMVSVFTSMRHLRDLRSPDRRSSPLSRAIGLRAEPRSTASATSPSVSTSRPPGLIDRQRASSGASPAIARVPSSPRCAATLSLQHRRRGVAGADGIDGDARAGELHRERRAPARRRRASPRSRARHRHIPSGRRSKRSR